MEDDKERLEKQKRIGKGMRILATTGSVLSSKKILLKVKFKTSKTVIIRMDLRYENL